MDAKNPAKVVKVSTKKVTIMKTVTTPTETETFESQTSDTTPSVDKTETETDTETFVKFLKKVSLAQEREQFFVFDALESNGFNDDQMITILGIKNSIQEQMEKRNAMLESDKFDHFKAWKKLKLKTPKVAKVAKTGGKKVGRPKKSMNYEKVQIPDMPDAPWYYRAEDTIKGEPGPKLFFDPEHLKPAGYWVNNMICPNLD